MQIKTALLIVTAVSAIAASAASLTVVNPGFDADVLADGQFSCNGTIGFTGWNSFNSGCGTGLLNPDSTMFPGGVAPSQNNVAYHNGPAGFWQALTDTYQAGNTYTFALLVGQRLDVGFGGYTIELRAGSGTGALLASTTNAVSPGAGTFLPTSVSYLVGTGNAVIGQQIAVVFRGIGTQTSFDNVTVDSSAVPEPGTYAMVGGAALLALLRRKRLKA